MKPEELREWSKYVSGIAIPILISMSITKSLYFPSNIWMDVVIWISIVSFIGSGITYGFSKKACNWIWKRKHKSRLRKSVVGIINEREHEPEKSRITPEKWKQLVSYKYQTKDISALKPEEISDDLVAVFNPYGECYPEVDMGERTTFKRIKEYVKNGGIFVSTCGCAFWYAWNEDVGQISTAGEVYGLQGFSKATNQIDILNIEQGKQQITVPAPVYNINLENPTYHPNPIQSLTDTLTFHELRLLTTGGYPRLVKLLQTPEERQKFGDIPSIALGGYIFEFRATRKPSQNFKPIVRAKIPDPDNPGKTVDIFPLAFVPHGKGKFIFTGMHMDLHLNSFLQYMDGEDEEDIIFWPECNKSFTDEVIAEQPKMVYRAVDKLIEEQKNKYLNRNRNTIQNNRNQNNLQGSRPNLLNCRM